MVRLVKRIVFVVILVCVVIVAYLVIPGTAAPAKDITWGVTFTKSYAQYLGLDWRQVYWATLDDLKIKAIRIGINWDEIEAERGNFYFADYDWMMDEAEKRGIAILPAIGY